MRHLHVISRRKAASTRVDRLAASARATVLRIKRPESGQNAGTERGKTRDLANPAQVLDNAALQRVGQ
jgi:hypothetical protein